MAPSSLKRLFSDSVIYGLSSIIGRFLNYLLVPLYTYKIAASTGGYAVVTNIYAYTAILLVILTFGMETTFFYFANKVRQEGTGRPERVFSTSLSVVGFVAAVFVVVVMLFGNPIADAIHYSNHPEYVRIMATVVAIDAFQAILFALLRYQGRPWKFAALKLAFIVGNIALNLFVFLVAPRIVAAHPDALPWYKPDYQVGYIFWVNLVCTATVTLGFIPELRLLRHGVDFSLLRQMLRYTWPLLLLGIVGILNQVADKICYRFIVPGPEGDQQLGIYGACVKIAMIMTMITQAFRYAYEPFVFDNGKGAKSKESQALVMKYFVAFTLFAFLCVVAYMDLLKHIIAPSYWEGLAVVPIVMLAEIFMGIYFNLSFWYKLIGQTWWGAIFSAIGCAALLAVNFLFVPRYGYMACAWGGFVGYGICMVLSYLVGQRKFPIPYPLTTIMGYFALAIALFLAMRFLQPSSTILRLLLNTLFLLLYLLFLGYQERTLVTKIARKLHLIH